MHQFVRQGAVGSQQLRRLREIRDANEQRVKEQHLKRSVTRSAQSELPPASRTVEAIVDDYKTGKQDVSTRLRNKVAAARRGMQTERSDREETASSLGTGRTTRKIAAVRRVEDPKASKPAERRRLGKMETEWMDKQLQYSTRAMILEKECTNAWQTFSGAAAITTGDVSTNKVNKLAVEMASSRVQQREKVKQELKMLRGKAVAVQVKVEEIANGAQFLSELHECIDDMETALAKFRLLQREQVEGYVLEEKVLAKELASFQDRMATWEAESAPSLGRGGASNPSLGPRMANLPSKSRLDKVHDVFMRKQSKSNNEADDEESNQDSQDDPVDEPDMVQRVRRLNDVIIKSGGLKGGWDTFEHGTFTTLLIKCGLTDDVLLQQLFPDRAVDRLDSNQDDPDNCTNKTEIDYETRVARFLRKCMHKIVTQSEQSVRSHFEWYLQHLELVEEKKRVIHEWKTRKEEERRQILQCGFEAGLYDDENPRTDKEKVSGGVNANNQRSGPKARARTERLLEQWKRDKKQKEKEEEQRRKEQQRRREAIEAKRKQEQLDAKQKVLLYKLQKEQEAMLLDRSAEGAGDEAPSPTSKEDLVERSRIAIEHAKAKRLRLQQIEERRQKQLKLPPRPENNDGEEGTTTKTPKPTMIFNATETSKARDLSKDELRKNAYQRSRQRAHEEYIPGKRAIPDVKVKSFGHVPIQPRAVPAWRKNL